MATRTTSGLSIPSEFLDEIRAFPSQREVEHCGTHFHVSSLDFYAQCPQCGARLKLRGFSGTTELADLVDAMLEWMSRPENAASAERRRLEIAQDQEE